MINADSTGSPPTWMDAVWYGGFFFAGAPAFTVWIILAAYGANG